MDLATNFVAFINGDLKVGEWIGDITHISPHVVGKPIMPTSRAVYLQS
jgi:hypothetical protein